MNKKQKQKNKFFVFLCYKKLSFLRKGLFDIATRLRRTRKTFLLGIVLFLFVSSLIFSSFFGTSAATFTWNQTSWQLGADTFNFASHLNNQTGWQKYYSDNSNIDATSIPGQISLKEKVWTQTDWSGGVGQLNWSDATKYYQGESVVTSVQGQVTLLTSSASGNGSVGTDTVTDIRNCRVNSDCIVTGTAHPVINSSAFKFHSLTINPGVTIAVNADNQGGYGGGNGGRGALGGNGGGLLIIYAADTITIAGSITADGTNGNSGGTFGGGGGGGSGGRILLSTQKINFTGTLRANGGNGGNGGYGGDCYSGTGGGGGGAAGSISLLSTVTDYTGGLIATRGGTGGLLGRGQYGSNGGSNGSVGGGSGESGGSGGIGCQVGYGGGGGGGSGSAGGNGGNGGCTCGGAGTGGGSGSAGQADSKKSIKIVSLRTGSGTTIESKDGTGSATGKIDIIGAALQNPPTITGSRTNYPLGITIIDANGTPRSGATVTVYYAGTTNPERDPQITDSYGMVKWTTVLNEAQDYDIKITNAVDGDKFFFSYGNTASAVYTTQWLEPITANSTTVYVRSGVRNISLGIVAILTSSSFDTGSSSSFGTIGWGPVTQPSETGVNSLKFQIATNSNNLTWNFVGPDGTANTFYTNPMGQNISSTHNGHRYIKYKAHLTTINGAYTPTLNDVSIEYYPQTASPPQTPFSQTNWSGGAGQLNWSDATKYYQGESVVTSVQGQVTLLTSSASGNGSVGTDTVTDIRNCRVNSDCIVTGTAHPVINSSAFKFHSLTINPGVTIAVNADNQGGYGGGNGGRGALGGNGGGLLIIYAADTITIAGSITADGTNGNSGGTFGGGGGGGSGGRILLSTQKINFTGTLRANGGNGGNGGYGGDCYSGTGGGGGGAAGSISLLSTVTDYTGGLIATRGGTGGLLGRGQYGSNGGSNGSVGGGSGESGGSGGIGCQVGYGGGGGGGSGSAGGNGGNGGCTCGGAGTGGGSGSAGQADSKKSIKIVSLRTGSGTTIESKDGTGSATGKIDIIGAALQNPPTITGSRTNYPLGITIIDANGTPRSGATVTVYYAGTTNPERDPQITDSYGMVKWTTVLNEAQDYDIKITNAVDGDKFFFSYGNTASAVYTTQWLEPITANSTTVYVRSGVQSVTLGTTGTLTSSSYDTGGNADFTVISWNPFSQPAGAGINSLKFQIATNSDNLTWNFKGPDGTSNSYYTRATGETIHSSHDGHQFVRYKAYLSTIDPAYTPTLADVSIDFRLPGILISSPYDTGDSANVISKIQWTENLPSLTDIKFQIRTAFDNNGQPGAWTSWFGPVSTLDYYTNPNGAETINALHRDGIEDQWVQYKAVLFTESTGTPILYDVALSYQVNSSPSITITNTPSQNSNGVVQVNFNLDDQEQSVLGVYLFYYNGLSYLLNNISNTDTTIYLSDTSLLPASGVVLIDQEIINYSAKNNTAKTITVSQRGVLNTKAVSHQAGASNLIWVKTSNSATSGDFGASISKGTGKSISWMPKPELPDNTIINNVAKIKILVNDNQANHQIGSAESGNFTIDTRTPSNPQIKIRDLDTSRTDKTNSISVNLELSVVDTSAVQMKISNNSDLSADGLNVSSGNWISYGSPPLPTSVAKSWILPVGEGTKTVYVQYRNNYGNSTGIVSGSTILDISPPAKPVNVMVRDISNQTIGEYGIYLTWEVITNPGDFLRYNIWRSVDGVNYGSQPRVQITDRTLNYFVEKGLSNITTYYYKITSEDDIYNVSNFSDPTHVLPDGSGGADVIPPSVTWGPTVTAVSQMSATIKWRMNEESDSIVGFSIDLSYLEERGVPTMIPVGTDHVVTLVGLTSNTTYHYKVKSRDIAGNLGWAQNDTQFVFTTLADTTPPVISNIQVTGITASGAIISWQTNEPATSQVLYGLTSGALNQATVLNETFNMSHTVILSGLQTGKTYYYRAKSKDSSNNETVSSEVSFVTISDTTPPVISNIQVINLANTSATITWQTDEPSTSQVVYAPFGGSIIYTPIDKNLNSGHIVTLTNLTPGTLYSYRVKSKDASANEATSGQNQFTTTSDTTPPIISNISVSNLTNNSATISWNTNEASTAQVFYSLNSGGPYDETALNVNLNTGHTVILTGLSSGFKYYFKVRSKDASNNTATSSENNFTTLSDQTPPIISNIQVSNITSQGATITWITNEPATSQVIYGLSAGQLISSTALNSQLNTGHSVNLSSLTGNTTYYFKIKSKDASNNEAISDPAQSFVTVAPPVISNVQVSNITQTTAKISWTTNVNSNSYVEYGLTISYGTIQGKEESVITHNVTVVGLTPGTTYYYRALSRDVYGNLGVSSNAQFTTATDTTPPTIFNVQASNITNTGALITWLTDEPSTTQVIYGTQSGNLISSTAFDANLNTGHSASLSNLFQGTVYYYKVKSKDSSNNEAISTQYSFTTTADTTGPVISNILVSNITNTGATITWITNEPSTAQVLYGLTPGALSMSTTEDTNLNTGHTVILTGLSSGFKYYFKVKSKDASNNETISSESNFTTTSDSVPPVISNIQVTNITASEASITWTTSEPATNQVIFGLTSNALDQSTSLNTNLNTSHLVNLTNLQGAKTYYFKVKSKDASNNEAVSSENSFTTITPPVINNLTAGNITQTTVNITWTTNVNANSFVEFGLNASYGTLQGKEENITSHSVTLIGLTPGTTYHYRARSRDIYGNQAVSSNAIFTTLTDNTPPNISSVVHFNISNNSVTITWITNEPSTSQVIYGIQSGNLISSTALDPLLNTGHTVVLTRLQEGTTYYYKVKSKDAANNEAVSSEYNFTTTIDLTPPIISNIQVINLANTSATITWQTNEPSTSQVIFGLTSAVLISETALDPLLNAGHSVNLLDLSSGTTYYFKVKSKDCSNNEAVSDLQSFTSTSDSQPPVITNVQASNITANSATITWTTDEGASSQVIYGLSSGVLLSETDLDINLNTGHTAILVNLTQGTKYYFKVKSKDASNNEAVSQEYNFTTLSDTSAPNISNVQSSGITASSATITWLTNEPATSQTLYGLSSGALDFPSAENTNFNTNHSVILTNLEGGKTYYYKVKSRDPSNNRALSDEYSFTTITPPIISNLTVQSVGQTTANIIWTTNVNSDSYIEFGLNSTYGLSQGKDEQAINHSVTLIGLTPGTTYHYRARSKDIYGNQGVSSNNTFTTTINTASPIISSIQVLHVNNNGATITWLTDKPAASQAIYGTVSGNLISSTALDANLNTGHTVILTGLQGGAKYYFKVKSKDISENEAISDEMSFITTSDQSPPVISNIQADHITANSAIITWRTNEVSTSQVVYGIVAGNLNQVTTLDPTLNTYHFVNLAGLTQGTKYYYQVKSIDASNNKAISSENNFTTITPPIISSISVTNISTNEATIFWTTNVNSDSYVEYGLTTSYGILQGKDDSVINHSVTLVGLSGQTTYHFRIKSRDQYGNWGVSSDAIFTTLKDTTLPIITLVQAINIANNSTTITWQTNEPATSQAFYGLSFGALISSTAFDANLNMGHSVNLGGLIQGTKYYYQVKSIDAQNNESLSDVYNFTTTQDSTPPVISNISISNIGASSTLINWLTNELADSQVIYGTQSGNLTLSTNLDSNLLLSHSVNLSGLSKGTIYYFQVKSKDASGNEAISGEHSFTTSTDITPPGIFNVQVIDKSYNWAKITWRTDESADSFVEYGLTRNYGMIAGSLEMVTQHSVTLLHLQERTKYYFRVRSRDLVGNLTIWSPGGQGGRGIQEEEGSFETQSAPTDSTPPLITSVASAVNYLEVIITWQTDEVADSFVEYGTSTAYGEIHGKEDLLTFHAITIGGLLANTDYHFRVRSKDLGGNLAMSSDYIFTSGKNPYAMGGGSSCLECPRIDKTAPDISSVQILSVDVDSVVISWATDEEATSFVEYEQRKTAVSSSDFLSQLESPAGSLLGAYGIFDSTRNHRVEVPGLRENTLYSFRVVSVDSSGNKGLGKEKTFATLKAGQAVFKGVSPMILGEGPEIEISAISVTIKWLTDKESNSLVALGEEEGKYQMEIGNSAEYTTSHAVTINNLTPSTVYYFQARSRDRESLLGESGHRKFVTKPKAEISEVKVSNITFTSAIITWQSSLPTTSMVDYGSGSQPGYAFQAIDELGKLIIAHQVKLDYLKEGAIYHFRVKGYDATESLIISDDYTFQTLTLPQIFQVEIKNISYEEAIISWQSNVETDSLIEYTNTRTKEVKTYGKPEMVKKHEIILIGLDDDTTYQIRIIGKDIYGNLTTSNHQELKTLLDDQPPIISLVRTRSSLIGSKEDKVQTIISWQTNEPATSQVRYSMAGGLLAASPEPSSPGNPGTPAPGLEASPTALATKKETEKDLNFTTNHLVVLTNLNPSSVYHFQVESIDEKDNQSLSKVHTLLTPQKKESILQIIIRQLEEIFGWTRLF